LCCICCLSGESQVDKARSLEPLIMEIERQTFPVLVCSHASTLQVLYGYFLGSNRATESYYKLWLAQHVVIELIPHQYGFKEVRHDLRTQEEKAQLHNATNHHSNMADNSPTDHSTQFYA
jgi:broad specificity phosphatase PhoE